MTTTLPETDIDDGDEYESSTPDSSPISLKVTPEFCGVRLDKALSQLLPEYSRSRLQQWIDSGHVTVDGGPARGKATMLGDETIVVEPQEAPEEQAFKPEAMPLS